MSLPKIYISWSSGKDSAFGFYQLKKQENFEIIGLVTTVNEAFERVAMHAVRKKLLLRQAQELNLPLHVINIPSPCSNEVYEKRMLDVIYQAKAAEVTHMMFGDLFLADVKEYREKMLEPTGLKPVFPLWQKPTSELAREIIAAGFKAVITCVDPQQLSPSFVGREFNQAFLQELPAGVDPCGENGEFHTFVYDGPIFRQPIPIKLGSHVERDGFVFADVDMI